MVDSRTILEKKTLWIFGKDKALVRGEYDGHMESMRQSIAISHEDWYTSDENVGFDKKG